MNEQSWILLDTETTGFKAPIYVVELGAQKMTGWEPDGPPFRRVLNHGTDIPPEVSRVNGYTREILERDGDTPLTVYSDFADYAGDLPLVAYNLRYDFDDVLMPEWERMGVPPIGKAGFCALKLAQRLLDPVPAGNCKLQTLRQYYRLPERGAHTALGDVETVVDLMQNVLRPLAEQRGLTNWDEIVAYTEAPWFPSRIPFGKFKDRRFIEAQDDPELHSWLEWLASSSNGRSAEMGRWYLQRLNAEVESPASEALVGNGVMSDASDLVVYLDPELDTLNALIAAARTRLADLEAEYTQEHHRVDVVQSELFELLRPLYEVRDRLKLVIQYRRTFIETLLMSGEEEAESVVSDHEKAQAEADREYEEAAAHAAESQPLSDEEEKELKKIYRKLASLYHPDRFAKDPEKQETYARLMSDINKSKDESNIQLLREISDDPESYLQRQGLGTLDFGDVHELSKLRALYESLSIHILNTIESLSTLYESSGYELYKLSEELPGYIKELASRQSEDISVLVKELELEAKQLDEEIEGLTGREDCMGAKTG